MIFLAFGQPGPTELLIVLAIVLLLFGAKKLPGLANSLGKSLSEFKKGKEEGALPSPKPEAEPKALDTDAADAANGDEAKKGDE